jgi:hypothetical protein
MLLTPALPSLHWWEYFPLAAKYTEVDYKGIALFRIKISYLQSN